MDMTDAPPRGTVAHFEWLMRQPCTCDGATPSEPQPPTHVEPHRGGEHGFPPATAGSGAQPLAEVVTVSEDDDQPVQCWHIEPSTPCDWHTCRQPERLARGDLGTDPAETPRRQQS